MSKCEIQKFLKKCVFQNLFGICHFIKFWSTRHSFSYYSTFWAMNSRNKLLKATSLHLVFDWRRTLHYSPLHISHIHNHHTYIPHVWKWRCLGRCRHYWQLPKLLKTIWQIKRGRRYAKEFWNKLRLPFFDISCAEANNADFFFDDIVQKMLAEVHPAGNENEEHRKDSNNVEKTLRSNYQKKKENLLLIGS